MKAGQHGVRAPHWAGGCTHCHKKNERNDREVPDCTANRHRCSRRHFHPFFKKWWKLAVPMAPNIMDEAVHRDARRLAVLTGKSLTAVVREALAAKLEEVEQEQAATAAGGNADTILAAARGVRAALGSTGHSADHAELYGEDGLPA